MLCCQQVRRGRYKNEVDVAVKMMKEGSMQEEDFIDEAKTMMYLSCVVFASAGVLNYGVMPRGGNFMVMGELGSHVDRLTLFKH